MQTTLYHALFLIFVGAGLMATLALYTRQSLLIAYMLVGVVLGPWGLNLIHEPKVIEEAGNFGIIFLLFLLGLHLNPRSLWRLFQETLLVTIISSVIFGCIGFALGYVTGFNTLESVIVGIAMMFSSTILGLKLLPTTVLHHQRIGEVAISVLLLQDIIAIFSLLALQGMSSGEGLSWFLVLKILLAVPGLLIIVWALEHYFLSRLIHRFEKLHEFIFLRAIAWCLGVGELAAYLGLSFEIGAFMAGVALAASPISRFIAESLKPLRDFFLILFFFSLGAEIDFSVRYHFPEPGPVGEVPELLQFLFI
jgi:Kef-type K+ transport system membrane component KefB